MSSVSAGGRDRLFKAFMMLSWVSIRGAALAGIIASVYVFNVTPVTRHYAPEQAVQGQPPTRYFDSVSVASMKYCQKAILVLYGTGVIMTLCVGIAVSGMVVGRYYDVMWMCPAVYIAGNHINALVSWSIHLSKYGGVLIPV